MNLKNKNVTVVGLGRSGLAAARFLAKQGAAVWATDASSKPEVLESARRLRRLGVEVETGRHTARFVEKSSLVVTSPGVPPASLALRWAKKKRIPVVSEIELASLFCRGRIVAVTGSNGKTTTCHLLDRILREGGRKSVLCGNVGRPFLEALPEVDGRTWVVLELSSFQLQDSPTLRPCIAVILNLSRNHLDRHGTFENYAAAKKRIFLNQKRTDALVLNHDDPVVRNMAWKARSRVVFFSHSPLEEGVFLEKGFIIFREGGKKSFKLRTSRLKLAGRHNLENVMAAAAVSRLIGLPAESVQAVLDRFRTLEHRVEPLGEIGGVRFMNDSKSTTVESTAAAIRAVRAPVVLVAGGRDKGADFGRLEPLLLERVRTAVLYGEARGRIARSWKTFKRWRKKEIFGDAMKLARSLCSRGDTLLLSPMCASFDQFASFEERGEAFKRLFRAWSR